MKSIMHILVYFSVAILITSCGSSSNNDGDNNDIKSGYYVTQYKNGNSIYKYEYNDMGQKIKTIEPDGDILTYTYNTSNQLMSIKKIKESGNVYKSVFTYNDAGKLVQQEEGSGTIYIFSYDDNGNLIKKYDKSVNKNVRIYSYNSLNQRIKVQDSKGIKRINYNTLGQIIKSETVNTKGEQSSITYTYKSNGQIIQGIKSDGNIRTYTYKNSSCINAGFTTTASAYLLALCKK